MDFKLNFLGITVADFEPSFHFYTEVLGIEARHSRHSKPGWAYLETTGMKFELFSSGAVPTPDRAWGDGQAFRPSLQVADLRSCISDLRRKGVEFVGEIESTKWCESIEFVAPEGIRWTLAHAPDYPFGTSLRKPHLGWVELKAHDLAGQQVFYVDTMGLRPGNGNEDQLVFRQEPGDPLLFLRGGGHRFRAIQKRAESPIFIGFETGNIEQAARWIKGHKVPIVTDVTGHPDWHGIDLIVTDVDGNPVQVVQYHALP